MSMLFSNLNQVYAWDPFGIGKSKENLDNAQKEMEKASIECIQTFGIDQCLLDCSSPEVNNPMLCVKEVKKVNNELNK
jgi:hypothetical protein